MIPDPFTPDEIEILLRKEIKQLQHVNESMKLELDLYKSRSDHWRAKCAWAYTRSREALLVKNRHERDKALCDINAKLGGSMR
jgi:hypothetical protein